jgi:hypothetical protein
MSVTGNDTRDKFLRRAIGEVVALHERPTLQTISERLPKDFAADQEEVDGMLAEMNIGVAAEKPKAIPSQKTENLAPMIQTNPEGHALASKSLENFEPPREAEADESHEDAADETPAPEIRLTAQEANAAILKAQNRLGEARIVIQRRRDATAKARAALATAITVWQCGLPPYSREQLVRDHLRSEQEKRRQRIEGGIPPEVKPVGKSAIDRRAAYSTDNSAEGFARKRNAVEGGDGARRGAFPKSMMNQRNFDPRRGPVFKPPGVKV